MAAPLLIAARVTLGVVFAVAAFAKLSDRRGARDAVAGFGVPGALVRPVALAVPVAELAAAVLLLPGTAVVGAAAGLGLLLVFSVAIAANLLGGRVPECHCFGQLHSAPAGPWTLARNALLGTLAVGVVAGGGGPSLVAWIGRLHDSGLVAFAAGAVLAMVLVAGTVAFMSLLRSHGRALVRLDRLEQALSDARLELGSDRGRAVLPPEHGLILGTPAPSFSLPATDGSAVALGDLLAPGLPLLLVFASTHCGPCSALLPEVARWQREHSARVTVAVASEGPPGDVRAEAQELSLDHVLLDEHGQLHATLEGNGTPGAVLIGADGAIASHVATGRDAIESLLAGVRDAPGLPVGAPAPSLELESLDGARLGLSAPSRTGTLVLLWNPDCGFCQAIHQDLLEWERAAGEEAPRLLVVSSGDLRRTAEAGFSATVLLDPRFRAGDAFGAGGTPSAVLLGPDSRVASAVAVGTEAVLGLARAAAERGVAEVVR